MTRKEITAFYQAHSRRLFNVGCRILQNPEDAECIRASIDRLRKRKREALFLEEYALESAAETEEELPEVPAARILEEMQRLPEPYRLVVTLVLTEGLDYQEIAAYTGLKETTLRSHFLRGKQKLIALLKENGKPI